MVTSLVIQEYCKSKIRQPETSLRKRHVDRLSAHVEWAEILKIFVPHVLLACTSEESLNISCIR